MSSLKRSSTTLRSSCASLRLESFLSMAGAKRRKSECCSALPLMMMLIVSCLDCSFQPTSITLYYNHSIQFKGGLNCQTDCSQLGLSHCWQRGTLQMELLQRKRSALRVEIRRKEVDSLMRAKREQLTFHDQQHRILEMINEHLSTQPSSIFNDLADYFRGCSPMEKKAFANSVWKYLVSQKFRKSSISCEGLPQLLICIIPLLTQRERRQLPPCKILPAIFQHFWEAASTGTCGDSELLETALLVSLDASKQSQQFTLRQQEIQAIICKAHQQLSLCSLQLLLLTLANLEEQAMNKHWKAKVKEIGRRAVGWFNDGQMRKMGLQLLLLIGRFSIFEQRDADLVRFLLQTYKESGFSLALRFLQAQSVEPFLRLQDAEEFLAECPHNIGNQVCEAQRWQQIDIYLTIIYNFGVDQDKQTLSRIYSKFFADRLHHFIHKDTANTLLQLANRFFTIEGYRFKEELIACGLLALKVVDKKQLCVRQGVKMGLNLLTNECADQAVFDAAGRQLFQLLLEHYKQGMQNDVL